MSFDIWRLAMDKIIGTGNTNASAVGNPTAATVESDCSLFTLVVYVAVFGSMAMLGLIGNGLSWVVLAWDRRDRGRVASFLLRTMAVADNLFLTAAGLAQISSALIFYIDTTSHERDVNVTAEDRTASGQNSTKSNPLFAQSITVTLGNTAKRRATPTKSYCHHLEKYYAISKIDLSIDAYLHDEQSCQVWSRSDFKRRSCIGFLKSVAPQEEKQEQE